MKLRARRRLSAAGVLVLLASLAACSDSGSTGSADRPDTTGSNATEDSGTNGAGSNTLKIGIFTSLTGAAQPLGDNNVKGARLAIDQVNAAGGIDGTPLELLVEDDKTTPDQAIIAVERLLDKGALAIVGSAFSNATLAAIPRVEQAKVPMISTATSDEQVDPVKPYVFMTAPTAGDVAEQIVQYLKGTNQTKLAVAVDSHYGFAVTGNAKMQEAAAAAGVSIVATEEFATGDTNFSALLTHIEQANPDAVMVWSSSPGAVTLTKQYRDAGLPFPLIMSHGSATPLYLEPAGEDAEGVIVAAALGIVADELPASEVKDIASDFIAAFEDKYGSFPPQFAFDAYNAVMLIVDSMRSAGTTSQEITDALTNTVVTLTEGTYRYSAEDHAGLGPDQVAITQVRDGQFHLTDWSKQQLDSLLGG